MNPANSEPVSTAVEDRKLKNTALSLQIAPLKPELEPEPESLLDCDAGVRSVMGAMAAAQAAASAAKVSFLAAPEGPGPRRGRKRSLQQDLYC